MVAAFAAAAWAVLRSMPIAALVGILMGVADTVPPGLPAGQQRVVVGRAHLAALHRPGGRPARRARAAQARTTPRTRWPRSTRRPRRPRPPCGPRRWTGSSGSLWYVLLGAFVVSMLTWIPKTWENVFNAGLAFSTIFLSITLITGMGGQLSLCQATLAGVGAFTAAQLANHLGLSLLVGRTGRRGGGRGGGRRAGRGLAPAPRPGPGPHDHRRRPLLRQRRLPPDHQQQRRAAQRPAEVGRTRHPQPQRPRLLRAGHGRPGGLHRRRPARAQGHHRAVPGRHAGERDRGRRARASTSPGSGS